MICPSLSAGWAGPGGVGSIHALVAKSADPSGPCFSGVPGGPPDLVFVIAANSYIDCQETLPSELIGVGGGGSCGPHRPTWELCVALPGSQLAPSTIDLTKHPFAEAVEEVNCTIFVSGGSPCDASGTESLGQLAPATLTIESVDPSSVTFTIDDKTLVVGNGDYTAQRCP
jgi:hypothetical protein